ncbi:MAG: MBL fold metallo-hydrolase, partial [Firmicutes bacterium]|nr:MBL fold metallo-hydrolase [Bacillota bacterium]
TYLVAGEECALVELGVSATAPLVARQVADLGIDPGRIRHLVVPHAHYDHLGGIPYFRGTYPRARVVASARAAATLARPRVLEQFFREDAFTGEWLERQGAGGRTYSWLPGAVLGVDRVVEEGDVLELGAGRRLEFLAAPGHSPCSLAVYLPEQDVLLVSDSLGFHLGPGENFPLFFQGYRVYLDTIARLGQLGARTVGLAHEHILQGEGVREYFALARQSAEGLYGLILERWPQGHQKLAEDLFDRY